MSKILAFGGSTRKESFNQRLVQIAADGAREAGADVTLISLREFPMPLFDEDFESKNGKPEKAKELKQLMIEYNR